MSIRPRPSQALGLLGLAGAACAVTLAACGGGDTGTAESTTAGGSTTSGAPAREGTRQPGNGIQEFGKEVTGSDLRQADEAVAALFHSLESGDWSEVCDRYLSRQNVRSFKKLADVSPQIKGAFCPKVLRKLISTGEKPTAPKNGAGAMRVDGGRGFALYRGTDGRGYAISLKKEDGRWKLNALRPTPLEP